MNPLDSWLHVLFLVFCGLGIRSVYKSKQKPLEKLAECLVLIVCAAMLVVQIFVRVWEFQLARGF